MSRISSFYDYYHECIVQTRDQRKLIGSLNITYINFFRYIFPFIKRRLSQISCQKSLLDLGCGGGTLSLFMGAQGFKVVGIDISQTSIKMAKKSASILKLNESVKFLVGDITKIAINKEYSFILCLEVLEHVQDDKKLLNKLFGLLSKGGLLIISVPMKTAPLMKLKIGKEFENKVGHLRRYTDNELVLLLKEIGFVPQKIIKTEGILRNSLFVIPILGNLVKVMKGPISSLFTLLDDISGKLFGYSDLIIILSK